MKIIKLIWLSADFPMPKNFRVFSLFSFYFRSNFLAMNFPYSWKLSLMQKWKHSEVNFFWTEIMFTFQPVNCFMNCFKKGAEQEFFTVKYGPAFQTFNWTFKSVFELEQVFCNFRSSSLTSFFRNFLKFWNRTISKISECSENPVSELF